MGIWGKQKSDCGEALKTFWICWWSKIPAHIKSIKQHLARSVQYTGIRGDIRKGTNWRELRIKNGHISTDFWEMRTSNRNSCFMRLNVKKSGSSNLLFNVIKSSSFKPLTASRIQKLYIIHILCIRRGTENSYSEFEFQLLFSHKLI